jgi:hypothetical protein
MVGSGVMFGFLEPGDVVGCGGSESGRAGNLERLVGGKFGAGWVMRGSCSCRGLADWYPRVRSWRRRMRALKISC